MRHTQEEVAKRRKLSITDIVQNDVLTGLPRQRAIRIYMGLETFEIKIHILPKDFETQYAETKYAVTSSRITIAFLERLLEQQRFGKMRRLLPRRLRSA